MKTYTEKGWLHREDGPAVILTNGVEKWYKHGMLHRVGGPAITSPATHSGQANINGYWGMQKWYLEGRLHRADGGPTVITGRGIKKWHHHGNLHRQDGPAVEYPDGGKEYWVNGRLHRETGPAIETKRIEAWFRRGKLHREDGPALLCSCSLPSDISDFGSSYRLHQMMRSHCFIAPVLKAGERQWWINGLLHREDGPAILYEDGTQKWCQRGKLHRKDGPAAIYPHGSEEWWLNGRLHNDDGPAVHVQDGYFLHHLGPRRKNFYSMQGRAEREHLLRRMEAVELPLAVLEETTINYVTRKGVKEEIISFVYKGRGECHFGDEWWQKGKLTGLSRTKRVLIIGAYGNFGSHIAKKLAYEADLQIIIAGRSEEKCRQCAARFKDAPHPPTYHVLDIGKNFPQALQEVRPDIVIHTSGPFQGQRYNVAEACIGYGCHYIDLADGREFVANIDHLDQRAKERGVAIISGASSVPCLTSAIIDHYLPEFGKITAVDYAISTAQRTPPGNATMAAILGYAGKPFKTLIDGRMQDVYGWQSLHSRIYPELGRRWLGNCDVPDLSLFLQRYKDLQTIRFYAGLEVPIVHIGLWALSWLVRMGLIRRFDKWAGFLRSAGRIFDCFGSRNSAFHMEISGTDTNGAPKTRVFQIIAQSGDGPFIPCIPSILLTKMLARGELKQRGAFPCMGVISLEQYLEGLKKMDIKVIDSERDI